MASSKTILITGGAGFIGANFTPYFAAKYPQYKIINLDKLTYAGNLKNLTECAALPNYNFVKGDICDDAFVNALFKQHDIVGVIHFAAESHVDNSITGPRAFIDTNITGTFNLLHAAFKHWMSGPGKYKEGYEGCRFHHISTDEVYGSLTDDKTLFTEATAYAPNSPYSASKAGADFLARSYNRTFGMDITMSNCSNNYGPKQHDEKLIPTIIRKCLGGQPIPIYGSGANVRDWLYVMDHCTAIDLIYHKGRAGETYNVGGRNERNNLQIARAICLILDAKKPRAAGKYEELITFVPDRPGHDLRYAIDAAKLETELGWRAAETFDTGIIKTIEWYLSQ